MQINNNIDPIEQSLGGVLHHRLVTNWFFAGQFVHGPKETYGDSWDFFLPTFNRRINNLPIRIHKS